MGHRATTWILNFHGLGKAERAFDSGEENVWLEEGHFRAILEAITGIDGIEITFDDGNQSDVEIALPELKRCGLVASFFISVGKLGQPGYLDESGIRMLVDEGMAIGSHGWSHRSWRNLTASEMALEFNESKEKLGSIAETSIRSAACPFGEYDRRVLQSLQKAGYSEIYTSDRGAASDEDLLRPRNTVYASDDPERVLSERLSFRSNLLRRVRLAYKRYR